MNINSIIWFLKRPQFIPQGFSILIRRFYSKKESTRETAEKWCKENFLSTEKALNLLIADHEFLSFKENEEEIYSKGLKTQIKCKVQMGGAGDLDLLYNLVLFLKPSNILETGVAYGWSSLSILSALNKNEKGRLVSTDMPYMHKNNEPYVGCVIPDNLNDRWELIREADITGLPKAFNKLNQKIDLCHYDSDKSYFGRMWAYPRIWSKLKSKGIFISDDIQDNIAFKEFSEKANVKPIIVLSQNKYVGILVKP